ncbi:MAG TPA: DUF2079 domain-containing protein [Ktedonobacteraceae bacterium]|nr:DUF2079 domain-containing protein [Ktedonobacteraceae bacterium]
MMARSAWRKWLSVWSNRLYLYPPPEPMPRTRKFWLALGMVFFFAALFSVYFIVYLSARHAAYQTNAEDLGIMDQAVWSTIHGQILHMTICNTLHDTNCYSYNGISRFAIHFEPILFPVSLLYIFWPDPRTLLVLQTLVVATGAFPAFWLARLRLRNEFAGVAIAVLYLLYPAQQEATIYDFHAVTFTAALLLFVLYFMYTRRTLWLFVFAILAMGCKEEIPGIIALFGLWSIVFQRRWRSGLGLIALGLLGTGVALLFMHIFSPTGHSLLTSRYSYLGNSPLQIVLHVLRHPVSMFKQHVLESSHLFYIRTLLNPAGYLPLLAPWVMVLALPTLALNLFSSDPSMYSGLFQYNAEIVPVLIFATIEAMVLILWLVQWVMSRLRSRSRIEQQKGGPVAEQGEQKERLVIGRRAFNWSRLAHAGLLSLLLVYTLVFVVRADAARSDMPFAQGYTWPQITPHIQLAQRFIDMIPPDASVSAQSSLVPHISHRSNIYLFPYQDDRADYIFLDVTGDIYPFWGSFDYMPEVKRVLLDGKYGIVAAQDGYILLKRGLPSPGISPDSPTKSISDVNDVIPNLPPQFCTFVQVPPQQIEHTANVAFQAGSSGLNLVGYNVAAASPFSDTSGYMQVTTYWKVSAPTPQPLRVTVVVEDASGQEHFESFDFPANTWCPTNSWQPGHIYEVQSRTFQLGHVPVGLSHIAIALVPLTQPLNNLLDVSARVPFQIGSGSSTLTGTGAKALELATIRITP